MMNLLVQQRTQVETLQLCEQIARNAGFPMDNLFTVEESFRALSACLRAMVTEAINQGATVALAAAQLPIGAAVNIRVTEQGFPPKSKDDDIVDLVKSFELAANTVLVKVDVDEILHTCLNP